MAKKRRYGLPNMYAGASSELVQDFFDHRYRDRGMKKWQGYYLSDHTSALNKQRDQYLHPERPLPEQTQDVVARVLDRAFRNGKAVTVQMRHVDSNGRLDDMLTGMVQGYQDNDAYIGGRQVAIEDIRHVQLTLDDKESTPNKGTGTNWGEQDA